MNNKEENVVIELTRKVCSRAKEHATKTVPEVPERKVKVHTGVEFKQSPNKKKLTVPKPFSFDTGPKVRKVIIKTTPEKTPEKSKGKGSHSKATTEFLKISKEVRSKSETRSASTEKTPKMPNIENLVIKKPCTRCSRSDKHHQDELAKTGERSKSQEKSFKSKTSAGHPSHSAKSSEVHFFKAEKSEMTTKTSCTKIHSSTAGNTKPQNLRPGAKSELASVDIHVKVTPPVTPTAVRKAGNSETLAMNGFVVSSLSESDVSNGIDGSSLKEIKFGSEHSEIKFFESSTKTVTSKIPRKNCHSGLKFKSNFRKETVPQPFSLQNRRSVCKKENIQSEADTVTA